MRPTVRRGQSVRSMSRPRWCFRVICLTLPPSLRTASGGGLLYVWPAAQSHGDECSIGDWQLRGDAPKAAAMPLHYSGAKYAEALRMKHLLVLSLPTVSDFEAWEVIPASMLRQALEEGRRDLDKPINRDSHTVWAAPLSAEDAKTHLQASQALVDKAREMRERGKRASAARAMPTCIQGKVLSAFMKNGMALCGGYQIGRCDAEGSCGGAHRCAVLLRQSRVCGGRRRADECRDKRAMAPESMPSMPSTTPTPAADVAGPPPKRLRLRAKTPAAVAMAVSRSCGGVHRCAVLLRQSRGCGGRHRADECKDKRAIMVHWWFGVTGDSVWEDWWNLFWNIREVWAKRFQLMMVKIDGLGAPPVLWGFDSGIRQHSRFE